MKFENNAGDQITSRDSWLTLGEPTSRIHVREYRSAFEHAHAWMEGDAHARMRDLLARLGDVRFARGVVERKTFFDAIPSGPRNHDLLLIGACAAGRLVVGVEAKADEPFDDDLARSAANVKPGSRKLERMNGLTRAFFGSTLAADPSLGSLRYQLLTALAGTLADARAEDAAVAALVVHEFDTPETSAVKHRLNAADLAAFVTRLGGVAPERGDWLLGPFTVPGNAYLPGDVPIYVGKLTTRVAHRGGPPAVVAAAPAPASARETLRLPVGGGTTVIKLNVHPPGCPCGCKSRGAIAFVLNRPGAGGGNRQGNDLERMLLHVRDLAAQANAAPPSISPITVGGGMATILLSVDERYRVWSPDDDERFETEDLNAALAAVRRRAAAAL